MVTTRKDQLTLMLKLYSLIPLTQREKMIVNHVTNMKGLEIAHCTVDELTLDRDQQRRVVEVLDHVTEHLSYALETSNSPHRDTEIQNRFEFGYDYHDMFDLYVYHESDPRNGVEGTGWVGETENGAGIRVRYEWN